MSAVTFSFKNFQTGKRKRFQLKDFSFVITLYSLDTVYINGTAYRFSSLQIRHAGKVLAIRQSGKELASYEFVSSEKPTE